MNLFSFCFVYVYVKQLMEEEEMKKLIKTILLATTGFAIGYALSMGDNPYMLGIAFMGLPSGYAFTSKYFMGYNLVTFLYKIIASILIGWIILPFSLTSGIIKIYQETKVKA